MSPNRPQSKASDASAALTFVSLPDEFLDAAVGKVMLGWWEKMAGMSRVPQGFSYVVSDDGEVQISHHGRAATVLRGAVAARFLVDVQDRDPQELMARLTGNYKRGNERMGKNHPRNRGH